ncbi:hypothetical protein [Streptococcus hyointestinalis]|uniref:hypothetical protein n=1 Tax=Streptococcus hyointestinalis TaxID=1337 RepID=UPI003CFBF48F
MEIVSKQARRLLHAMMKVRNNQDYIIHDEHPKLFEKDNVAMLELQKLNLIKGDYQGNVRITNDGLIYLRQYKTYIRQKWFTSFWVPLAVSIIGTTVTLMFEYYLLKK